MDVFAVAPQPRNCEGFVELSRTKQGRLFRKHILNFGKLHYNGKDIDIDDEFYSLMLSNFQNGIGDIVQVPIAGDKNEHTEDPNRNIGEVVGLSAIDGKIYVDIDARDEEAAKKLGKTLLGASAGFYTNYLDTSTGKRVGPTLIHVAITNRPYVTRLDGFEEVLLSRMADGRGEAVFLTADKEENSQMTLDELFTALKVDHDIDVKELQRKAEIADRAVTLSSKIRGDIADAGFVALSAQSDESLADIEEAIEAYNEKIVELSAQVEEVRETQARSVAEARVQELVDGAYITEDKKETYIKLAMTDVETFEAVIPTEPMVVLSQENGSDEPPAGEEDPKEETDEEIVARIANSDWFNFSPANA